MSSEASWFVWRRSPSTTPNGRFLAGEEFEMTTSSRQKRVMPLGKGTGQRWQKATGESLPHRDPIHYDID
ncbi:unnamed protein product [Lampetra fluviatilis]